MIHAFATSPTVRAIGWALMQSIWQGALIGAITALALRALRGGAADPTRMGRKSGERVRGSNPVLR